MKPSILNDQGRVTLSQSVTVESEVFVPRGDFIAWVVCLSAGLFFLYEFFQLNLFDVINQSLRDDFHINATQISWMSSAYLWADLLFLLPAGILLDRYSTRTIIIIAMLVCVLGTIGFALTDSFVLACFFHFLTGIGNAFSFISCVVLISQWFPPKRQAFAIGCIVTMAFTGGMMAHTPFALLNDSFGWRNALLMDGVIGIVLVFLIYALVQDRPEAAPEKVCDLETQSTAGFMKALLNAQNWLAGLFASLLNLPIMVLCALWGANYLQVVHHLSEIAASNVVSLIFMGSIIGCPLLGWCSDFQGRRKPLMLAGAVTTCLVVLPLFVEVVYSQTVLGILFFALGLFSSAQVLAYPLVAESNPPQNTGAATGIASLIIMGGAGVAQIVFGWLMAHHAGVSTTHYHVADFQYAMWIFPVAAVVALIAVFFTRETYCKR